MAWALFNEYPMGIEWAYHLKNVFGRGAQIVAVKCNQKLSSSVLSLLSAYSKLKMQKVE